MSADTVIVRDAAPADADALAEFNCLMALETEDVRLTPAVVKRGVDAVFEEASRGFYVVAEVDAYTGDGDGNGDGDGAGARTIAAALLVTREWSDWRDAEWWWIQSVYVRAPFRRRGLYRMLYEHVAARAANEKVCGFRLYVERDNSVAQQTYAALGMRETRYKVLEQLTAGAHGDSSA